MKTFLAGRDEELRWLEQRLRAAHERGRLLIVSGEPGVGKTALIRHAAGSERTWISFPPAKLPGPGYGLRRLAEALESGNVLERELAERARGSGLSKQHAIHQAANEVVRAQTRSTIVLDDLQWADELTRGWLAQSNDLLMNAAVAIVVGVRATGDLPGVMSDIVAGLDADRVEFLRLRPLSVEGVLQLVERLRLPMPQKTAADIHARTDGLPVAVSELLNHLATDGSPEGASLSGIASSSALPVFSSRIQRQLRDLPRDAQDIVALFSLMPSPSSERLARLSSGLDDERFDTALGEALASGLLISGPPGETSFRHHLHREVVQSSLPVAEKRACHRKIAHVLENDPHSPAGDVAQQLLEAGSVEAALVWFEKAAEHSMAAHDHGNALAQLAEALRVCPQSAVETRTRLAELAVLPARSSDQLRIGLALVRDAFKCVSDPAHKGRLLVVEARLVAHSGDFTQKASLLKRSLDEFTRAGDEVGMAYALGSLALPQGTVPTLTERIELGKRGLQLAQRIGDDMLIAVCAGNLAAAEICLGDSGAFRLWRVASDAIARQSGAANEEERLRTLNNWALGASAYGAYKEVRMLTAPSSDGIPRGAPRNPYFNAVKAVVLWRGGRWDDACAEAAKARSAASPPQVGAVAVAVQTCVAFEREPRPDIEPLVEATKVLVDICDEFWAPFAQSMLMRARAARREPRSERGLIPLMNLLMSTGVKIGWDDVLPAAAEVNPAECERVLSMLGDVRPLGKRGDASMLLCEGILAANESSEDAEALLNDAVEAFQELGEPYLVSRALDNIASHRRVSGKTFSKPVTAAASILRDIGADRSLANLLRRFRGCYGLEQFRIPNSQTRMGSTGLTVREREIADLARRGYTARAIAAQLDLSIRTTENHLERIKRKLGAERKSDLVRLLSDEREP
jgi:DNA-binding CsgD family transcriptional regulator